MKFKDFFKAKKGKELIEIMILFPVMLFLIIYTTLNVTCYIISSEVQDTTVNYARIASTQRTYYKALCAIADEMKKDDKNATITEIKLYYTISESTYETSMSFSDNSSETTHFKKLIKEDKNGNTTFNVNTSDNSYEAYKNMETFWNNGVYIKITTFKGVAPLIKSVSQISLYNASTKERYELDYGMSGAITCSTTSVIIA